MRCVASSGSTLFFFSLACILLWSSAVRVYDSQAYRKMDVTMEHISRIFNTNSNASDTALTLFLPSNFEWATSPSPSNIGAKTSTVGMWQEKRYKNAHILTAGISVLPSLSDTTSLSSSPVYSESSTHPPSESSALCRLSSSMKSTYPVLKKN